MIKKTYSEEHETHEKFLPAFFPFKIFAKILMLKCKLFCQRNLDFIGWIKIKLVIVMFQFWDTS